MKTQLVSFKEAQTQREQTLAYLHEHNGITALRAVSEFGETRLSARIHELRNEGWFIHSDIHTALNGRKYVEYSLAKVTRDEFPMDHAFRAPVPADRQF